MSRGGRRAGKVGKAYANRTDLNTAAPSKQYGSRTQQEQSMQAVPVAPPPAPSPVGSPPPGGGAGPLPGLFDPTHRPDEPLTHGAPFGEGPGLAPMPQPVDPVVRGLTMLQQLLTPDADTKRLISQLQAAVGNQSAP